MFPGVPRNNKSQRAPQLFHPGPDCPFLCCALISLEPGESWPKLKNYLGTSGPRTRALEGVTSEKREGEGISFPPELLRLDCEDVKSFLVEAHVPQLIKVICKSVFLPLESTVGYRKALFSTIKFLTGFIVQKLCFSSTALCVRLWIQKLKYQGGFLWIFV